MPDAPSHEVIIIGTGVAGIYQLHRLVELGVDVAALEAAPDLGGTWYRNRYPGCRFDSESYTYGYSFSKELLAEWHWSERFAGQPENLRYLNHVANKFDLRRHMQFNCRVVAGRFEEAGRIWRLTLADGRSLSCRFLITAVGPLSVPTLPRIEGRDSFRGLAFHTHDWPQEPVELTGKRVAVIGTGATGVQLISAIADQVQSLTVFQRRPNWCAPLNNGPISTAEMAEIRTRYDDIFAACTLTPSGFEHRPDPRKFYEVSRDERLALWNRLYGEPGFGIWLSNFREIFTDEAANAEFSAFIADKIRARVRDPRIAEKLIPSDHGFGFQRVPLETRYYETYNRDNVTLVDGQETPIRRITPTGVETKAGLHAVDIIVYATGFDAITGAYDRIDIRGSNGASLREAWEPSPRTYLGMQVHGFPNLITLAGPQTGSATTNYPRGIETAVDWVTGLIAHTRQHGVTRMEATAEAERQWTEHVTEMYAALLLRTSKGWFTGYNSNVPGHEAGKYRHIVYHGGAPKYRAKITAVAEAGYEGIAFT